MVVFVVIALSSSQTEHHPAPTREAHSNIYDLDGDKLPRLYKQMGLSETLHLGESDSTSLILTILNQESTHAADSFFV